MTHRSAVPCWRPPRRGWGVPPAPMGFLFPKPAPGTGSAPFWPGCSSPNRIPRDRGVFLETSGAARVGWRWRIRPPFAVARFARDVEKPVAAAWCGSRFDLQVAVACSLGQGSSGISAHRGRSPRVYLGPCDALWRQIPRTTYRRSRSGRQCLSRLRNERGTARPDGADSRR